MPRKNLLFKQGQNLFTQDDESNGMYIVRKGEIEVYLAKGEDEIKLATLKPGGMLGEMALFDHKPRSASARAISDCEVTLIDNEDFNRILNQIPKWFVSLMTTLSNRLRQTNKKLQIFENSQDYLALRNLSRSFDLIDILFSKYGEKNGKIWQMNYENASVKITKILNQSDKQTKELIKSLMTAEILQVGKDRYNHPTLILPSKGELSRLAWFIDRLLNKDPTLKKVPDELAAMIHTLNEIAVESAYEQVSISWSNFIKKGYEMGLNTENWINFRKYIVSFDDAIHVGKNGDQIAIKIERSLIEKLVKQCQIVKNINTVSTNQKAA